jgi:hypothetical protein
MRKRGLEFRILDCGMRTYPIADCGFIQLRIADLSNCGLRIYPIADCGFTQLRIADLPNCGLRIYPIADCGFRIADLRNSGLWISDCGFLEPLSSQLLAF